MKIPVNLPVKILAILATCDKEIIFTIMDVNTQMKKRFLREKDLLERKAVKNKRVWMTEELFCKLDELKHTLKFKSYEEVFSYLLTK